MVSKHSPNLADNCTFLPFATCVMPEQHESMSVPHVYNMGFSEMLKSIHSDDAMFRTNDYLN